jgi:hypothetical protein
VRLPLSSWTVAVSVRPVVTDFQTMLPPIDCHVPSKLPGFSVGEVACHVPLPLKVMVKGYVARCALTVPLHVPTTPV